MSIRFKDMGKRHGLIFYRPPAIAHPIAKLRTGGLFDMFIEAMSRVPFQIFWPTLKEYARVAIQSAYLQGLYDAAEALAHADKREQMVHDEREALALYELNYPGLPWRTPLTVVCGSNSTAFACRVCIGLYGLNASRLQNHPKSQAEFDEHFKTRHLPSNG